MLGTPVGFLVGGSVGVCISGVGFGDMDGLVEKTAVGAVEFISDGIAVSRVEGAELGLKDIVGASVTVGVDRGDSDCAGGKLKNGGSVGAAIGSLTGSIVGVSVPICNDRRLFPRPLPLLHN